MKFSHESIDELSIDLLNMLPKHHNLSSELSGDSDGVIAPGNNTFF
jgi:hypothetical protein